MRIAVCGAGAIGGSLAVELARAGQEVAVIARRANLAARRARGRRLLSGGEKVAPLEVDNVLSAHPAVAQALTFAVPHAKLGEEVGAAVVLREGASASESELRAFAAERLADFKVPRRIVFLEEIPKGATGKLQRIGLAERLGLSA
jgi:acyl-CoA synthetase (AMP-forming)/AMP-acid ligase II